VIPVLRPKSDAGTIVEPEPTLLRLLHWHLKPLTPPQSLDPPVTDRPPRLSQQGGDPSVAVTPVLSRQRDHVGDQTFFVFPAPRNMPLGRSVLAEDAASPAL